MNYLDPTNKLHIFIGWWVNYLLVVNHGGSYSTMMENKTNDVWFANGDNPLVLCYKSIKIIYEKS